MKQKQYRVKFDGSYVRERDYRYLVECKKEESIFSEGHSREICDKVPTRATRELIEDVKEES